MRAVWFWLGVALCVFTGWAMAVWIHDHITKSWAVVGHTDIVAIVIWALVSWILIMCWDEWQNGVK